MQKHRIQPDPDPDPEPQPWLYPYFMAIGDIAINKSWKAQGKFNQGKLKKSKISNTQ